MIQIFTALIWLQFIVVAIHDWIHIPGLTHGRQMMAVLGRSKMILGTVINCVFPGLAAGFAAYYWGVQIRSFVRGYWVIYCAITVLGATTAWWIPYFKGTDEKTTLMYKQMYAGTLQILPPRGDNPRPNVLHLFFHLIFLATLVLSVGLWWRGG